MFSKLHRHVHDMFAIAKTKNRHYNDRLRWATSYEYKLFNKVNNVQV